MRIINQITQDEMIAEFLKGEITSKRFGAKIVDGLERRNFSKSIITAPNIMDNNENDFRSKLLGSVRGFGLNKSIFEGFPKDVTWNNAVIDRDEFLKIKYIDYDYWVKLSSGTRLPLQAAKNINAGTEVFDVSNKESIDTADFIKKGGTFPKMILVTTSLESDLVALEGHLRLTAYALVPDLIPEEFEVILGLSEDIKNWNLY